SRTRSKISFTVSSEILLLRQLRACEWLLSVDGKPKKARKFAAVAAPISCGAKFLTGASVRATSATNAGSLRLPRKHCGARNGESVSIKIDSSGKAAATSRKFCALG